MISSELKFYLETNLPKPSLDFKWSDADNKNLFLFIGEKFSKEDIKKDEIQEDIKKAFKNFFEPVGYILIQIKNNRIRLKVFPYTLEPKDSVNLSSIIEMIQDNLDLVKYVDNRVVIKEKLRKNIYNFVDNIDNEEINKKELARFAVRKALGLKKNDIVIIKKEQIFIKIFNDKKMRKVSSSDQNTIAGRFNGIEEAELDDFYDEYFSKEESRNFFKVVVKLFVETYFIEEKIDNLTYETNVFGYIQSLIIEQLMNEFDCSEEFYKGFSGYILRIHFNDVFELIADFMLNEISLSNEYIIDFLKYYSLNIVIVNGVKYKVPELETEDGLRWNVISMLSIAKIYTRTKATVKELDKEIHKFDEEILKLYINGLTPVEYNNIFIKEKQKIAEQLRNERQKLEQYMDTFRITKDEARKKVLNNDINRIKREINQITLSMDKLSKKEIRKTIIDKYQKLEKEMDSLLREQKAAEKILTQNEKSYQSIKKSLVKALISKKQRI